MDGALGAVVQSVEIGCYRIAQEDLAARGKFGQGDISVSPNQPGVCVPKERNHLGFRLTRGADWLWHVEI